jgi:hypothetical protein
VPSAITLGHDVDETRALEAVRVVTGRPTSFEAAGTRPGPLALAPATIIQEPAPAGRPTRAAAQSLARST